MARFLPGHHEELSLVARGRYSSLRPEATTIEKSQICRICQIPPQLVMAEGHTILKLQELFSTCTVNMVLLLVQQPIAVRRGFATAGFAGPFYCPVTHTPLTSAPTHSLV